MWDLCTAYCLAIKVLIKNTGDTNRALMALAAAQAYANSDGVSGLVNEYI